ncbi:hypothetical protein PPACK8108_LOCUS24818 [Phakopsora pachyrhizi]|uniref:Uncharacterized protein n=1 Tax=Phakopsora pachyrhizi TaxID=170000 RepID=A0AAV0BQQ0_PHAPC|nr:hypothetical protein PPACK8108_LOCUS24818 [Phakopsora pachyrhizi]
MRYEADHQSNGMGGGEKRDKGKECRVDQVNEVMVTRVWVWSLVIWSVGHCLTERSVLERYT